jgi:glycosyltransferase involved in cell wall biosynthesis
MSKREIKITVLMPAYNSAKYIKYSIKSILDQTFKDFEFLIIDDGSTDNTEEVVSSFKDSRIVYKKTEHKGTSAALNSGVSSAAGNWIARIDSDDLNVPERLEKQVKFISENPGYDIISCRSVFFREPHKILFFLNEPEDHEDIYDTLNLHNPINSSGVIYKKNIIKKAKYNESFSRLEDFELFFRIRDEVRFYNIPEYLAYTRLRKNPDTYSEDKHLIFEILNDYALKKLINSNRKRDQFYWATRIAGQNFFYGNKKNSRSYYKRIPNIKNTVSYAATFLPEKIFRKLLESRIRYRMRDFFKPKKKYINELKAFLS